MRTIRQHVCGMLALAVIVSVAQWACGEEAEPANEPDQRVAEQLDEIGWKYEVDADGDFRLVFRYPDGRTQIVFINSQTESLGPMEIREVWAAGFRVDKDADKSVFQSLLEENELVKLGAWRLVQAGEDSVAVFAVQLPADADTELLRLATDVAGITADKAGQQNSEEDEF